jgi:hypothetical protein
MLDFIASAKGLLSGLVIEALPASLLKAISVFNLVFMAIVQIFILLFYYY